MAKGTSQILQDILDNIYQNTSNEITGQTHQDLLTDLVNSLAPTLYDDLIPYSVGELATFNNSGFKNYLCISNTVPGESPTTTPAKWTLTSAVGVSSRIESIDTLNSLDFESVGEEGNAVMQLDTGKEFSIIDNLGAEVTKIDDAGIFYTDEIDVYSATAIKFSAPAIWNLGDVVAFNTDGSFNSAMDLSASSTTRGLINANIDIVFKNQGVDFAVFGANVGGGNGTYYNSVYGFQFNYNIATPSVVPIGAGTTVGNQLLVGGGSTTLGGSGTVTGGKLVLLGGLANSESGTRTSYGGDIEIDGGEATGTAIGADGKVLIGSIRGNIDIGKDITTVTTIEGVVKLGKFTATEASALTPTEADLIFVTSTNGTFTAIGVWAYENGAWAKL